MEKESKLLGKHNRGEHYTAASGRVDVRVIGELWMEEDAEIGPQWDNARQRDFTIEVTGTNPMRGWFQGPD